MAEKEELSTDFQSICKFINKNPDCQSLLYDLNLLPETTKEGSLNYIRMIAVVMLFDNIHQLENEVRDSIQFGSVNTDSPVVSRLIKDLDSRHSNG